MAKTIRVKAVEGRIARTSPHGEFIPHDRYIDVEETTYVRRLLNWHGDIEQEPKAPAPTAKEEKSTKAKETPKEK